MGVFLVVPFSIILIVIAYNLLQQFKYKLPPGPTSWPIIGKVYEIKPVRFRCFHEWAQTYGPIISFKLGSELNVVVSNAELAKQVLKEHDQYLADRQRPQGGTIQRDDVDFIWADYGPHYVKVRKVSSLTLFNPKKVGAHRPIREDEVTALVESLFNNCTNPENKGKALTIRKYIDMLSFNNITRITFGKRFVNSKGELDFIGKELKGILTSLMVKPLKKSVFATYLPWIQRLTSPSNKIEFDDETTKLRKRRDQIIKDMIKEQVQAYDSNKNKGDDSIVKQHFVEALLTLKDEYDLSEDDIFWLCWDMIVAGVDTVAISIEWALAEMIRNPRVQKKAQEELDQVIGPERIMTEVDFSNLPYLKAIAKECFRLHPPTPLMLPHKARAHVKIGGYDIPKGSIVHVNAWAMGRDPNVWGDVNEFRPERFMEEDIDMKGHDFRLLTFGAGRRICPGAQVGINLVTSTLGHLLHHFEWKPPNGVKVEEIDMKESPGTVTHMKNPLQAVLAPRLPTSLYKRVPVDL